MHFNGHHETLTHWISNHDQFDKAEVSSRFPRCGLQQKPGVTFLMLSLVCCLFVQEAAANLLGSTLRSTSL